MRCEFELRQLRDDFFTWLWQQFGQKGLLGVHEGTMLTERAHESGLETESDLGGESGLGVDSGLITVGTESAILGACILS